VVLLLTPAIYAQSQTKICPWCNASRGSWQWNANNPQSPVCSNPPCANPVLGEIGLNGDLWNMGPGSAGAVTMSFNGALSLSANFSTVERGNAPGDYINGYPSLTYGYQPLSPQWTPNQNSIFHLPMSVSSFPNMWSMVNYSLSPPSGEGQMDFAYDIWITKPRAGGANATCIGAGDIELMIFMFKTSDLSLGQTQGPPLSLPTWVNGALTYPMWQAYVGQGATNTCGNGLSMRVSLLLQNPAPGSQGYSDNYLGISIGKEIIQAAIQTLVGCSGNVGGCFGETWSESELQQYEVNNITLGSEFGCALSAAQCLGVPISYRVNISNYCFAILTPNTDPAPSTWSLYSCPSAVPSPPTDLTTRVH
jgi:Glycosyl hydrolase family 12